MKNIGNRKFPDCFLVSKLCRNGLTSEMSQPGASIYLLKVNNGNISKIYEICLKLKIETPEPHRWRCSSLFIVIFEQFSQVFLVFPLLTLKKLMRVTSWRLVNVTYQSIFTKNIELKIRLNFPIFCCAYSNIIPLLLKKFGNSKKSSLVFQSLYCWYWA